MLCFQFLFSSKVLVTTKTICFAMISPKMFHFNKATIIDKACCPCQKIMYYQCFSFIDVLQRSYKALSFLEKMSVVTKNECFASPKVTMLHSFATMLISKQPLSKSKKHIKVVKFLLHYWDERIRTFEWRTQIPTPYHLATPHKNCRLIDSTIFNRQLLKVHRFAFSSKQVALFAAFMYNNSVIDYKQAITKVFE